jgi:hypothetical protein
LNGAGIDEDNAKKKGKDENETHLEIRSCDEKSEGGRASVVD